jgi:hypothetical protein
MRILQSPMGGEGAGAALAAPAPEAPAEGAAKTFSVPVDVLPDAKPGDTFKVQSIADGNVMLEHQAAEGSEDGWGDELKKAAPAEEGGMV